jgi:ribosomal protein S18 acetylase RimI-like enzyme
MEEPSFATRKLTDRAVILPFLETNRSYAAYAIGDLEPGMAEHSTWAVAEACGPTHRVALARCVRSLLALCFRGLPLPVLFLMGDAQGLRAILQRELCPESTYITCLEEHLSVAQEFLDWDQLEVMRRMVLSCESFRPASAACVSLSRADLAELRGLYAHGGGDAFGPRQLEQGVFFGIRRGGRLVAAAGTHLVSPTYGLAAIGNVFTHPGYRQRGYARACTSAVAAELFRRGIRDLVLNVNPSNLPALSLYQQLGFSRYCEFLEGQVVRR